MFSKQNFKYAIEKKDLLSKEFENLKKQYTNLNEFLIDKSFFDLSWYSYFNKLDYEDQSKLDEAYDQLSVSLTTNESLNKLANIQKFYDLNVDNVNFIDKFIKFKSFRVILFKGSCFMC